MLFRSILCFYYNPLYSFEDNGEFIKTMAEIGGKYIALMGAVNEYTVNDSIKFDTKDYGGFQKSPIGNKFSDKFVLFSILCQINFLIYGVERWIKEETPTKLRFMYLLYYSLLELLPQINQKLNTAFKWLVGYGEKSSFTFNAGDNRFTFTLVNSMPLVKMNGDYLGANSTLADVTTG